MVDTKITAAEVLQDTLPLFVIDFEGGFMKVNSAGIELFGYEWWFLKHQLLTDFIHPLDIKKVLWAVRAMLRLKGRSLYFRFRLKVMSGIDWVWTNGQVLYTQSPDPKPFAAQFVIRKPYPLKKIME